VPSLPFLDPIDPVTCRALPQGCSRSGGQSASDVGGNDLPGEGPGPVVGGERAGGALPGGAGRLGEDRVCPVIRNGRPGDEGEDPEPPAGALHPARLTAAPGPADQGWPPLAGAESASVEQTRGLSTPGGCRAGPRLAAGREAP